jgi:hypothetical protein
MLIREYDMYRRIFQPWPLLLLLATLGPATGALGQDCVLNGNPACATAVNLGAIPGDAESPTITRTGVGEAFFVVRFVESSSGFPRALNGRVTLQVPPRQDYDLVVRCTSCTSTVMRISRQGVGITEQVTLTRTDTSADNSFTVLIEIRFQSGTSCSPWTLTIGGNTPASQAALSCS